MKCSVSSLVGRASVRAGLAVSAVVASFAAAPSLANVVVFEKFNQGGTDWAVSTFSDVTLLGAGAMFERGASTAGLGAPNTTPALPINQDGDKEGRFFESGGVATASFALTADVPASRLTDASIDTYVAFGVLNPGGTRSAGLLLRATEFDGVVNGYIAVLSHDSSNMGTITIARLRDNIVGGGADTLATSEPFPMSPDVENYHLYFAANGPELEARLHRVEIVAGAVTETRVDLLPEAGVQSSIIAVHHEIFSGRAGVRAFARNGNSVFFDEADIVEHGCDNSVTMESQSLGTAYGMAAGNVAGDLIFTEDSIPVRVHDFFFTNGNRNFGNASITRTFDQVGFGRIMLVNNINIGFNFSSLGRAGRVTIEFGDQGGFENLEVNNAGVYVGELSAAPANIAPDVTATVVTTLGGGTLRGVLTLEGSIFNVRIGGQEFFIDDICATTACACDWNTDFFLNSQDFFDFLVDFFNLDADYNMNGVTDSQDYFDFLTCFFTGCE